MKMDGVFIAKMTEGVSFFTTNPEKNIGALRFTEPLAFTILFIIFFLIFIYTLILN